MNEPESMWNEDELRERMQRAFATASAEVGDSTLRAPAALGRRALEAAQRNGKRTQPRSARRLGMASTLLAGAAVALLTWRSHVPNKHRPLDQRPAPTQRASAPAHTLSDNGASARRVTSLTIPSSAKRIERPTTRTRAASTTFKPSILDAERLSRLQQAQAEDFQSAARLLEQAGQVEPAYRLYSQSIEAAPTLDATLGVARVLKRMDEATVSRDEGPTSSSFRFEGTTSAG